MKIRLWDEVSDGSCVFDDVCYAEGFEKRITFQTHSGKTVFVDDISICSSYTEHKEIDQGSEHCPEGKRAVNLLYLFDSVGISGRATFCREK